MRVGNISTIYTRWSFWWWVELFSVVWMAWNSYRNSVQIWVKKRTKTRSIHVHKLNFIALNDCFWVSWNNWGEKMFKSITVCENCFDTSNSYPNGVGVSWGYPTPLPILYSYAAPITHLSWLEFPVSWNAVPVLYLC